MFRVPAIISLPARIPAGVSPALASSLDILPTVLGLLDIHSSSLDNVTLDGWVLAFTRSPVDTLPSSAATT